MAYTLLFEFATRRDNTTQTDDLAELIADADPDQFRQLLAQLDTTAHRDRALALLSPRVQHLARFDDELARRQGRIALALLRLGRPELVWPLFRHYNDPSVRTELIHNLARFGFDPAPVVARLRSEPDISARRGLLLCLGEFSPDAISGRPALVTELLSGYRTDPDPGIHGALDWLLRQPAGPSRARWEDRPRASPAYRCQRTVAGMSAARARPFTIVRGGIFLMGSTQQSDPDRYPDEVQHLRQIDRSFAIATREVTLGEYERFLAEKPKGSATSEVTPTSETSSSARIAL